MSDLIDRQAVIEAIEQEAYRHTYIDQILDIIKSMPSVQPEIRYYGQFEIKDPILISEQRWILCSERLPEDYEDVLVWFEYFRYGNYNCLYQMYGIGSYSSGYDSWLINQETGWNELKVFAWMHLPKPPKEEDE